MFQHGASLVIINIELSDPIRIHINVPFFPGLYWNRISCHLPSTRQVKSSHSERLVRCNSVGVVIHFSSAGAGNCYWIQRLGLHAVDEWRHEAKSQLGALVPASVRDKHTYMDDNLVHWHASAKRGDCSAQSMGYCLLGNCAYMFKHYWRNQIKSKQQVIFLEILFTEKKYVPTEK